MKIAFRFLIVFFIFPNLSFAITYEEFFNDVIQRFPKIQAAKQEAEIARGQKIAAEGGFDLKLEGLYDYNRGYYSTDYYKVEIIKPTPFFGLDIVGGYRLGRGNFPVYEGKLLTLDEGETNFGFNLPLLRGFIIDERRANLKKAELQAKIGEAIFQQTELEEIKNAMFAYLDWLFASKKLHVNNFLLETANERDKWLGKRVKAGDLPKFERDDNQRSILKRQSDAIKSLQQFQQESNNLTYFATSPDLESKVFAKNPEQISIPEFDKSVTKTNVDDLIKVALKKRPDLQTISLEILQNEVDQKLQNNKYLPKLDLKARFSNDRGGGTSQLIGSNTELTLNLELPLEQRALRGKEIQFQAKANQLELKQNLIKQKLSIDIKNTLKLVETSLERFNLAKQEVELAHKLEQGERTRFKQGDSSILTINLREQAAAEAELRLAETHIETIKYIIYLKILTGELPQKI